MMVPRLATTFRQIGFCLLTLVLLSGCKSTSWTPKPFDSFRTPVERVRVTTMDSNRVELRNASVTDENVNGELDGLAYSVDLADVLVLESGTRKTNVWKTIGFAYLMSIPAIVVLVLINPASFCASPSYC